MTRRNTGCGRGGHIESLEPRRLFAVPGTPGTDNLIATGAARAVRDTDDLVGALAGEPPRARVVPARFAPLMAALGAAELGPAELARRLGLALGEALALIGEAELDGWLCRRPGGALASMENTRGN